MASEEFVNLVNEIDGIAETLGNYATQVGAHLANPSNPLPHFTDLTGSIKMDQLITTANQSKDKGVTLATGAVTQTLYKAAGILREVSLRTHNKASFYQRAQLELGAYTEEVSAEAGKSINRVRNSTPEQNTGI